MMAFKTELGLKAFKERDAQMSPRQRSAFILFDGHRTVEDVLAAAKAGGVTVQDIAHLLEAGWLTEQEAAPAATATPAAPAAPTAPTDPRERYQTAYPIATRLTAGLGLRGFRLNLAIEAASTYEALLALAPKIREAVGDGPYRELDRALRG